MNEAKNLLQRIGQSNKGLSILRHYVFDEKRGTVLRHIRSEIENT